MRLPQPFFDRVTTVVAAAGAILFLWGIASTQPSRVAWKCGGALVLLAYFAVLIENAASKREVRTRGGVVGASHGAVTYLLPYVPLALLGVGLGLVLFLS